MKYLYYNPNQNNSVSDSSSILTLARSIMFLFCLGLGISIYSQEVSIDFTSSGTWTVPTGVTQITVEAWGAGGGGGGSNRITMLFGRWWRWLFNEDFHCNSKSKVFHLL